MRQVKNLFDHCQSIKNIDIRDLNICNVESTVDMFNGCSSLEVVNMLGVKTDKLKNMNRMFKRCTNLREVKGFSNINMSKVNTVVELFKGCKELSGLDISLLDLRAIVYADNIFDLCFRLRDLKYDINNMSKACFKAINKDLERIKNVEC